MSDVWLLRTGILIAGILLVAAIYFFGRPRRGAQGRRVDKAARNEGERMEPTLGAQIEGDLAGGGYSDDAAVQSELSLLDDAIGGASAGSDLGRRDSENFDKIISLYVAARAGQQLQGPDIVVAAEKAGLTFGHMNVFHRLMEGHPERGPIFSVANIMKPGSFEMAEIQSLQTPAIAFFLTLPAPLSALEAWDTMLPTAQRMAELLNGVVLDQERNALGRQRIAHIRDDLRAYDRQHEAPPIKRSPRW
ncbi:cell division protein ZipA [Luteimonas sp. SX5]|uniref:Cell division protein ZipA n=1 Tax=Luteimonas galliterrae TaxID=2940486 RepID=A0ABT0MFZ3_9GAMM|nr:cell division protein ZipA [Luteimonas galliterrae]MCL1633792.1 cell division protein ZipA [Luteimonas galliterrae]